MNSEPPLTIDPSLLGVLNELISREPIFHRVELGTERSDFEKMTDPDFWETGASGKLYSREYVLDLLQQRHARQHDDHWEASAFRLRKLAQHVYLVTYTLLENKARKTRRATIWQHAPEGWTVLYHQGTIVQEPGDTKTG